MIKKKTLKRLKKTSRDVIIYSKFFIIPGKSLYTAILKESLNISLKIITEYTTL